MAKVKRDFVVETKGHCFLCLSRTSSTTKSIKESFPSPQLQSLQCFSRYLNIDMRKVFLEDADIPPRLLAKVRESKLKVELCEECVSINGRFSGLYRQLERVEMEMQANLKIITSKLTKEAEDFLMITGEEGTGKLQVVTALRKEALEKCSQKLTTVFPRSSIQNLTIKQLRRKIKRVKYEWNKNWSQSQASAPNIIGSKIKKADSSPASQSQLTYDADYNEHQEDVEAEQEIKSEPTFSPIGDAGKYFGDNDGEVLQDFDASNLQTQAKDDDRQNAMRSRRSKQVMEKFEAIPAPLKVIADVESGNTAGQVKINPETGKHECQLCPKEYSCAASFYNHFRSAHLKQRFKCVTCGKDFSFNHHYKEHYLSTHLRIRYKCTHCDKLFRQKRFLDKHQKSDHLEQR